MGRFINRATVLLSTAAMLAMLVHFSLNDFSARAEDNGDAAPILSDFDVNGNGVIDEEEKGWGYALDSADDLYWFADKINNENSQYGRACAFLTDDITVNANLLTELITVSDDGTVTVNEENEVRLWTPIGNNTHTYRGTFDGAGHTISGLYFNENRNYAGLFGLVEDGNVRNVGVTDSYICGQNYIGGICGKKSYGTIADSYNKGVVSGTGYVAGICGINYGTVENCYNTGKVTASEEYAGGICGRNYTTISNCYYMKDGNLQGIGLNDGYFNGVTAMTEERFQSGEAAYKLGKAFFQTLGADSFPVFDSTHHAVRYNEEAEPKYYNEHAYENGFCTVCGGCQPANVVADVNDIDGDGHTDDDVYEISNAGQLYWFAGLVNGTLEGVAKNRSANAYLANDITVNENLLTDLINVNKDDGTATVNEDKTVSVWTPIGTDDYSGTFDGAGHTVSGLYCNNSDANRVGLFGYVRLGSNSKIMNLTVADSYFCGKEKVGGICGIDYYVTIQNCANTGVVKGENYVGGVCGYIYNRVIENCYNTGRVWGDSDIGGICGYSDEKNIIRNCFNTGEVNGYERVGGICGKANYTGIKVPIMIINCYNTGAVTGTEYFGSICGVGYIGSVVNCYYLKSDGISGKGNGADSAGSIEVKSVEQFASGEVCWLLNGGESQIESSAFFQNLGERKDTLPVLDSRHGSVYQTNYCVTYSNTDIGVKEHSIEAVEKVEAICVKDGVSNYWHCKDCEVCFSDENGESVINDIEAWKTDTGRIPATGIHAYTDGICEQCGAFEDGIGAKLAGYSVSLDGSIGVNFHMQLSETVAADENAYLLVNYPNGSDDKLYIRDREPVTMNGKSYYVFCCKVAADEMTDTITAQIVTSNGSGKQYSYSVKDYADYLLAHTEDNEEYAKAEKLVRAMLTYGTYSQLYFGYRTSEPAIPEAETDLSALEDVCEALAELPAAVCEGVLPEGMEYYGNSLILNSNITYRTYFLIENPATAALYDLEESSLDNLYYVENETVGIAQMGDVFEYHIGAAVLKSCPLSYVSYVVNSESSEKLTKLCIAIYDYCLAAEEYAKKTS